MSPPYFRTDRTDKSLTVSSLSPRAGKEPVTRRINLRVRVNPGDRVRVICKSFAHLSPQNTLHVSLTIEHDPLTRTRGESLLLDLIQLVTGATKTPANRLQSTYGYSRVCRVISGVRVGCSRNGCTGNLDALYHKRYKSLQNGSRALFQRSNPRTRIILLALEAV